jgi:predicted N-acetyltransferase YhbS
MKKTQAFPHISDYKIVLATENEISTIRHLVNAAYQQLAEMGLNYTATFQDEEKTRERISTGRCFLFKANEQIIGTILFSVENHFTGRKTAYLGQFGVWPEYKKQGIGSSLMDYCEKLAQSEGFEGIQLDTAIPAQHLVDWYLKRGYETVGQVHFDGKTYDSYIFEKRFPSAKELT